MIFTIALLLLPSTQILATDMGIIHQEKSAYRDIFVRQSDDTICLSFTEKRPDVIQACMNLTDPDRLIFPASRLIFATLLLNPAPKRILITGLGGGSVPKTLHKLFPDAEIDISELDQAVVNVAKDHFLFSESQQMNVTVGDARVFVKRALLSSKQYDLIILDAFDGTYIPEHLMTQEFLSEVRALLSEEGVLAANTFSISQLYDHESVTYQRVWGSFFNVKSKDCANRIIITRKFNPGSENQLPNRATLEQRAEILDQELSSFGIDIRSYVALMSREIDWNVRAVPLTDQYAPANLLKAIPDGSDIKKFVEVYGTY